MSKLNSSSSNLTPQGADSLTKGIISRHILALPGFAAKIKGCHTAWVSDAKGGCTVQLFKSMGAQPEPFWVEHFDARDIRDALVGCGLSVDVVEDEE